MPRPSILIIGASGRLGLNLIQAAAALPEPPAVHAFLRTPSKLPPSHSNLCQSVLQGDGCNAQDIGHALQATSADIVIVAVGVPNSLARSDLRRRSAQALMQQVGDKARFPNVKVVCVSSTGAGGTTIDFGMGVGRVMQFMLRHIMADHTGQEAEMKAAIDDRARLWIVRPTSLTDGKHGGKVVTFDGNKRAPGTKIDRADVARWIMEGVCGPGDAFGGEVCITAV